MRTAPSLYHLLWARMLNLECRLEEERRSPLTELEMDTESEVKRGRMSEEPPLA